MRISEFESLVQAKKMRLERRVKVESGDAHGTSQEIFIAEGYCPTDRDYQGPHYKTMYAISDGPEHIKVGEFFTTPIIFPIIQKSDRLDQAEARAKEFLVDMRAECQK